MSSFGRVYRLVVGTAGGTGTEVSALRCTFEIAKSATNLPNTSRVTVYNLSPVNREAFERPDLKLILYAGYAQDGGPKLMHSGNVFYSYTRREGANFATELQLGDGHVPYRDTMISLSIPANGTATTAISQIASAMGLGLRMDPEALDRTWKHGFSYYGPARVALGKVTAATGLEWSIQNGVVQIIQRGGTTSTQALLISADTGMILSPERMREGAREAATVVDQSSAQHLLQNTRLIGQRLQYNGWRVSSLLLPTVNPGDAVQLMAQDKKAQGTFRVQKLFHRGDSTGGEWKTELELLDVNDYAVAVDQYAQKTAKRAAAAAKRAAKGH